MSTERILQSIADLPNHRTCNDEEYTKQQRCTFCAKYSTKSWGGLDYNSGKCFGVIIDGQTRVRYTDGMQVCDAYEADETYIKAINADPDIYD